MYVFTGNNLFGQWSTCSNTVIDKFCSLSNVEPKQHDSNFSLKDATLISIGWSHNIFYMDSNFFITGDYKYLDQYLDFINLPKDCINASNVIIVSNEHHLVVINKNTCTFWTIDLENKKEKSFNLITEIPHYNNLKKLKSEERVLKCVAANNSLLFLTSSRFVYSGVIPNLVDTSRCVGEPIDVQCGNEHFMLLTASGRVYSWGNGRRLQLGHGDVCIIDEPTEIEALSGIKIVKISAGGWHSLALSEFGDVYAWGWNDSGQLGIKETADKENLNSYSLPTLVDIIDESGIVVNINVKDLACGSKHSAILLDDNSVWTSGNNKYGQLGLSLKEHTFAHHFKKCCSFSFAHEIMCGQWSTVVNVMKP